MQEILKNAKLEDQTLEIQEALQVLYERINKVRAAYAKPMIVTSGLRTMEDHLRIYRQKGITDQSKIPMKSKHLFGQAVDVSDPKGEVKAWVKANLDLIEKIGLWMEAFDHTPTWVHFQIVPPASGRRFFIP